MQWESGYSVNTWRCGWDRQGIGLTSSGLPRTMGVGLTHSGMARTMGIGLTHSGMARTMGIGLTRGGVESPANAQRLAIRHF